MDELSTRLAQHYKIPSFVGGSQTDSKLADLQAGQERTLTVLTAALAGANMIYGLGMVELGMTMDLGLLLADNEFVKMVRRMLEGIPVNDDTMAVDVIRNVGIGGEFVTQEHTFNNFRKCQSQSNLIDRSTRNVWLENGAKDMAQRCNEMAREIIETHKPDPLSDSVSTKLADIIKDAEKELVADHK